MNLEVRMKCNVCDIETDNKFKNKVVCRECVSKAASNRMESTDMRTGSTLSTTTMNELHSLSNKFGTQINRVASKLLNKRK